ncbi:hypothetical protein ACWEO4_46045 [Streptomyces sp. NPDC004393]
MLVPVLQRIRLRLLPQYHPKGADLRTFSQADLDAVAPELNRRPRKTHGTALGPRSTLTF